MERVKGIEPSYILPSDSHMVAAKRLADGTSPELNNAVVLEPYLQQIVVKNGV